MRSSIARAPIPAAKLSYIGHALAENRHGLIVEVDATKATSRAEREAALAMIERHDPAGRAN
jgi:hypothetical protein